MTAKDKTPIQMAGEVARLAELEVIALRSWIASFVGDGVPAVPEGLEGETERNERFVLERSKKLLDVFISFSTSAREADDKTTERFRVSCELVVRYSFEELPDLNEEHFKHFAHLNAIVNAWPYFRELVQSSASRMGLPPVVLPLFRIPRTKAPAAPNVKPK